MLHRTLGGLRLALGPGWPESATASGRPGSKTFRLRRTEAQPTTPSTAWVQCRTALRGNCSERRFSLNFRLACGIFCKSLFFNKLNIIGSHWHVAMQCGL